LSSRLPLGADADPIKVLTDITCLTNERTDSTP
jgi:hypothetical protein